VCELYAVSVIKEIDGARRERCGNSEMVRIPDRFILTRTRKQADILCVLPRKNVRIPRKTKQRKVLKRGLSGKNENNK